MPSTPITIFTTPKPFTGHFGLIQRNALASWRALDPSPEIIVFGNELGAAEAAAEVGALHVPDVRRNAEGTPLISAMFDDVRRLAAHPILCYANADIIFFDDLYRALEVVECQPKPYLLTGRRHDTVVQELIDFRDGGQVEALRQHALQQGKKYPPGGMDYFIFRRGVLANLPDFAVGRPRWDNWMLYYARKNDYLLVDATDAVFAIHQNHDYSHHAQGTSGVWEGKEAQQNLALAGGWDYVFTLADATHEMSPAGLKRVFRPSPIRTRLRRFGALHPRFMPAILSVSTAYRATKHIWQRAPLKEVDL
jgi:hypothetical protein